MPRSCSAERPSIITNSSTADVACNPMLLRMIELAAVREVRDRGRGVVGPRAALGQQVDLAVLWNARVVSTMSTNSSVGPSIGTVTDQNRRIVAGAVDRRRLVEVAGMPCRPAVTRMNVNPRFAHTLDSETAVSAVPGSRNQPGSFTDGNRLLIHADVRQHTHVGLQQEQPHQAGHGDRGGDRGGEDRPEDADAAQVGVGQHREADAEHQPERHGDAGRT
jgi:hypothetical protein